MAAVSDNVSSPASNPEPDEPAESQEAIFPIAPMDVAMKFSTVMVLALLGVVAVGLMLVDLWLSNIETGWLIALGVVIAILSAASVGLIHLYSRPKYFAISAEGMRIVWPGRSRKLPKAAFAEMRPVTGTDLGRLTRRFGLRGVLGCFGWFTSEYMGNVDAYVTRNDGLVYLRLKNRRPLLLTPTQPKTFLDALRTVVET
ncbi:MAG: hypothetical protein JW849_05900 [Phycisphaerae bacterium]|nr:hypothetical protein [Phycisphaerae bacterium]